MIRQINTAANSNFTGTDSFALSRHSKYLSTVLHPWVGAYSIPDGINAKHHLKSTSIVDQIVARPISANINSAGGLFLWYLNNPGPIVGAHYRATTINPQVDFTSLIFDKYIRVDSPIEQDYTFARHVSAGIDVIANTISTTNFSLSGTASAIYYEGAPSELLSTTTRAVAAGESPRFVDFNILYAQLTSNQTEPCDKIGNQLMANGISAIALPTNFDIPFARLGDHTPVSWSYTPSSQQNEPLDINSIEDDSLSIQYTVGKQGETFLFKSVRFNADIPYGTVQIAVTYAAVKDDTAFKLTLYSPTGYKMYETTLSVGTTNILNSTLIANVPLTEPLGSVEISEGAEPYPFTQIIVTAKALNCGLTGKTEPLHVMVYSGVSPDAKITISGVKNFELIPNAQLKKNLDTKFYANDFNEMNYIKKVLSMRRLLQIKSVMSTLERKQTQQYYLEIPHLDKNEVAEAFDWGALLKGLKAVAVPAIEAFVPELSPALSLANQALDAALGTAHAASGTAYAADDGFELLGMTASARPALQINGVESTVIETHRVPVSQFAKVNSASLFPVIITKDGVATRMQLFAILPGQHPDLLPVRSKSRFTVTKDHRLLLGVKSRAPAFNVLRDFTMVPVAAVGPDFIDVMTDGPILEGNSYEGALYALTREMRRGVLQPITGNMVQMDKGWFLADNPAFWVKDSYCRKVGVPLLGSVPGEAPIKGETLVALAGYIQAAVPMPQVTIIPQIDDGDVAHASDTAPAFDLNSIGQMLLQMQQANEATAKRLEALEKRSNSRARIELDENEEQEYNPDEAPSRVRPSRGLSKGRLAEAEHSPPRLEAPKIVPPFRRPPAPIKTEFSELGYTIDDISDEVLQALFRAMEKLNDDQIIAALDGAAKGLRFKGPNTDAMMSQRTSRRYAQLKEQYPDITEEWIYQNGNKGPTTNQAKYFSLYRVLPAPGTEPADMPKGRVSSSRSSSSINLQAAYDKFVQNNVKAHIEKYGPQYEEELRKLVTELGKLPNADQFAKFNLRFGTDRVGKGKAKKPTPRPVQQFTLNAPSASGTPLMYNPPAAQTLPAAAAGVSRTSRLLAVAQQQKQNELAALAGAGAGKVTLNAPPGFESSALIDFSGSTL